jgi:hypothetical protein
MPWGAAIGAVGALGSAAINKSGAKTGSQNTSDDAAVTQATDSALSQAETIAQRAYTPYNGQVVAPLSSNEQQAYGQASGGSALNQEAAGDYGKAESALGSIDDYNSSTVGKYMDPYVSSVLTPQLNQENINYQQQRNTLLNSKAGAFGGDRSALEEGQLDYQHGQNTSAMTGKAYSDAYTNAQNAFFQDQSKKVNAANAYDQVGGDASKLNTQQVQDLMATGQVSRALQQSQLDFNYSQFVENRDWSVNNLQPLLQTIGAAKGTNVTTTKYGAPSNPASAAIGAAATVAGAYFTGGKSGSSGSSSSGSMNSSDQTVSNDAWNELMSEENQG